MTTPSPTFLARTAGLLRRPAVAAAAAIVGLGGAALTRLPLFEVPGYELGAALTLAVAVLGAIAGVAAARRERGVRPASATAAFACAGAIAVGALLVPLLAAVAGALLGSSCSPWMGLPFYALLPVPSALLASAVGVLLGSGFARARAAGLAYAGLLLVSLASSLWPLWAGPQVFALDPLLGYFPGPLYDESLPVEPRLLAFRALTIGWVVAVLAVAQGLLDPASGRLGRTWRTGRGGALLLAAAASVLVAGRAADFRLGLRTRDADLEATLGGRLETARFVVHFPKSKTPEEVQRLERDLEFKLEQVVAFFEAPPYGKIVVWLHRSAEEKRRLVGAAETSFAKPWRSEFHVHDEPFPHPVLRHEMAHVAAAPFGAPPFGVSARWGAAVNIGLVEGLAVAADDRADELTLHQWAAAMRRLRLAPDIRGIVGPAGFYRQSAARAYTLAGSFLRWLRDTQGAEKLRRAYRDGDFEAAYGRPLDALASDWERFLDSLELDERGMHAAQVRFERPSLFDRPCAREVARLRGQADAARQSDPELAVRLYQRCERIEPQNPGFVRAQAEVLAGRRDWAGARAAWVRILALEGQPAAARAQALMGLGDALWAEGELPQARAAFEKALALHRDRATDRAAAIKIEAVGDPQAGPVVRRFFEKGADLPEVLAVAEAAQAQPANATARYLVGRQLLQRMAGADAARWIDQALAAGLADPELVREARRMLAQARYLGGDCPGAVAAVAALAAGDETDQAFAEDWRARCAFETRTYGGALAPPR